MKKQVSQHGFTIIELLIATVIFSIVLLMLAGAIVEIGRVYSKGLNNAHTQEVTRQLVSDVASAIQLTPGDISNASGSNNTAAYCIGAQRYSYILGQQVDGGNEGLVFDALPSGTCASPLDITQPPLPSGAQEVLGKGMRLAYFNVDSADDGKSYTVAARVIFGDDDLLCDNDKVSCTDGNTVMQSGDIAAAGENLRCKDIHAGSQYCAVSELKTTVERRIQNVD